MLFTYLVQAGIVVVMVTFFGFRLTVKIYSWLFFLTIAWLVYAF